MKLISCHIASFGKFLNKDFDFKGDIITFKEGNGWGKTTLAAFLECMLYGMENGRGKSACSNLRAKYEPWQGGAYGGTLVFSSRGRVYRVERTFGKTAASDTVRVYDENAVLMPAFSSRDEALGETLFGLDRESFRRSVYIPQGEIQTGALPDTLKNRLLVLLGGNTQGERGAQSALERLDEAERALRAKRRPSKGKLDELDDALISIQSKKDECRLALRMAEEERETWDKLSTRIRELNEKIRRLESAETAWNKQSVRAAALSAERETQLQLQEHRKAEENLRAFFKDVHPSTINTEGLEGAVKEFYSLQSELASLQPRMEQSSEKQREMDRIKTQLETCKKTLESYSLLLKSERETEGAGKERKEKVSKKSGKKSKFGLTCILAIAMVFLGAIRVETTPTLGIALIVFGAVGLLLAFITQYKNLGGFERREKVDREADAKLQARYAETKAEYRRLTDELTELRFETSEENGEMKKEYTRKRERADALEEGICRFLGNFTFDEVYDYRAALSKLKENSAEYAARLRAIEDCETRLRDLAAQTQDAQSENIDLTGVPTDINVLRMELSEAKRERDHRIGERERSLARMEDSEDRGARISDLEEEETRLKEEYARLEKRLNAIRIAREVLLRAQENMAAKYLVPVENACKKYASILNETGGFSLRFSASGETLFEENGMFRGQEYYSTGIKELIGLCTRLALAETVFFGEPPVLILDDPLVNLDDDKTERAKRLLKELSKKYQLVYFTCKKERTING